MVTCTLRVHDFKKKNHLSRIKSSKNTGMLSKSILIGLFVLKNYRTIREPKSYCPTCFLSGGYRWHRKLVGLFTWAVMGGMGVNGLIN